MQEVNLGAYLASRLCNQSSRPDPNGDPNEYLQSGVLTEGVPLSTLDLVPLNQLVPCLRTCSVRTPWPEYRWHGNTEAAQAWADHENATRLAVSCAEAEKDAAVDPPEGKTDDPCSHKAEDCEEHPVATHLSKETELASLHE